MEQSPWIRDVGDADFEREVVKGSEDHPVVVDFWAPWCAPCRVLGPILERLAEEYAGEFVLARVDVDAAPGVASALGVRSIPTLMAFRDGAVVAELGGAQPEPVVRQFLAQVLPSQADRLVREAEELAAAGDAEGAEARLRAALEHEPAHAAARLGLARRLAALGETEQALEQLERVGGGGALGSEAEQLAASLRTRERPQASEAELRARLAARPGDLHARLDLGRTLAAQERYEEALQELLEVVRRNPGFADEAARKAMLDVFALLGPEHSLTARYRGELARVLFR